MREGDFPQAVRNSNIIAVTVDLPLVPAIATVLLDAMMEASTSERCTMGRPRAYAAAMSGFDASIAVETQTASVSSPTFEPSWGTMAHPRPSRDCCTAVVSSLPSKRSEPEAGDALKAQILRECTNA